jgi:hypothetical protein
MMIFGFAIMFAQVTPAHAQHGDYLLGTAGLIPGQQAPEGILYQNLWSYYTVSNSSFVQTGPIKCGPLGRTCLSANVNASGSLDMFVDQNIFWLVTPFKIPFIGAAYGALVDVPFAIADASGAGSIQPSLTFSGPRNTTTLLGSTQASSGGVTKGSIADIYFEPIDLGWHFKQLDAIISGAFMAPTGPYNADAGLNIGYGHWSGLFGLGGTVYADPERTWALSLYSHYEMYSSQEGRPYTLGDEVPFEWGAAKAFNLPSDIFKQITFGAAGYAQWQTTDNQINVSPATAAGSTLIHRLQEAQTQIYAAGPAIQMLTKYGLFALRYYDEFGASATPSGQQLMFSVTLAGKPWS